MELTVVNDEDTNRYVASHGGTTVGFAAYRRRGESVVFTHTEVGSAYEGQGVAGTLVRRALDDVRAEGLSVVPRCPFVKSYIERHCEEYGRLVR